MSSKPGTKIICTIIFSIAMKEGAEPAILEAEFRAQPELPLEKAEPEECKIREGDYRHYIRETYQLNDEQVSKMQGHIAKNGMKYVLDKIALTESQPRDNMAGFFLAALRDDYKMPVRHVPAKKAKTRSEPEEPKISEEQRQISLDTLKQWRLNFAG